MKNILIFTLLIFNVFNSHSFAQDIYAAAQTDLIFSMATMNATNISTSQVVRFSGFLNHETQRHVNFNKKIGYYTGLGIKNIGMINRFGDQDITFGQIKFHGGFG